MNVEHLNGIKLKLDRASKQLKELKTLITAFDSGKPYRVDKNVNPKTGEFWFDVHFTSAIPGIWGILIGEYIYNLRSALDHLVYELVVLETGRQPPTPGRNQFPIFLLELKDKPKKQAGFFDDAKPMLVGVGTKARALIQAEQPFATGENKDSPLWLLQKISNWDKHRSIPVAYSVTQSLSIQATTEDVSAFYAVRPGPLKDRAVIAGGMFTRKGSSLLERLDKVNVKCKFTADIGFERPDAVKGRLVGPTLSAIGSRVVRILNTVVEGVHA